MSFFRRLAPTSLALALTLPIGLTGSPSAWAEANGSIAQAKNLSEAFEKVAESTVPSVVNIKAIKKPKGPPGGRMQPQQRAPDPYFEPFRDFFGDEFFDRFGQGEGVPQEGLGTGVIIDEQGHILTNNHVIGEADDVEVRIHNRQERYSAKVIGSDPRSDLAIIKIDAPGVKLAPARLGDSDNLKIGEWVLAIGNPFNLDHTVTAGIVSAKGRTDLNPHQYEDFIQTDAAINPGNSGGPLVNLDNEVVGINTAIFSRSGGYMGIGFAIPSNMVRVVMKSLIDKGRVIRGWLGVGIQPLTEDLAKSFNYPGIEGALVGQVQPEGPAEKAGLKQGDIVVEFNGTKVKNVNHLRNLVAETAPATQADVIIVRDGRKETISVKIEELPAQVDNEEPRGETPETDIGLSVESLTPDIAQRLGARNSKGVVVTRVTPGSVAHMAQLAPRDIIVSINGQEVTHAKDFRRLITEEALKKGIRLVVETNGMERFVILRTKE